MYQITDGTFAEARRYCITIMPSPRWSLERVELMLVQSLVHAVIPSHAVETHGGVPGSQCGRHSGAPSSEICNTRAQTRAGRAHSSLRRRRGDAYVRRGQRLTRVSDAAITAPETMSHA